MSERTQQMTAWLDSLGYRDYSVTAASEDASFRCYHRLQKGRQSWILMDAPPEQEPCDAFIAVAQKLRAAGLSAPEIIDQDLQQGFLLLTDFGDTDYLTLLNADTEATLYGDALSALLQMQTRIDSSDLPCYNEALLSLEMGLFNDWFLQALFNIELSDAQTLVWSSITQMLITNAFEQPKVFVHRDYHSRNLMKIDTGNPGILDFQDAVNGPISYDLVSLLRDCYIDWPPLRIDELVADYHKLAVETNLTKSTLDEFKRWFNLMGVQRHLKAIGIFSRLNIRDGKPGYLRSIPRTLQYILQVCNDESSMNELGLLITDLGLERRVKSLL